MERIPWESIASFLIVCDFAWNHAPQFKRAGAFLVSIAIALVSNTLLFQIFQGGPDA